MSVTEVIRKKMGAGPGIYDFDFRNESAWRPLRVAGAECPKGATNPSGLDCPAHQHNPDHEFFLTDPTLLGHSNRRRLQSASNQIPGSAPQSGHFGRCGAPQPQNCAAIGHWERQLDQTPMENQPRRNESCIDALPRRGASTD
jgi:hypothetical protein